MFAGLLHQPDKFDNPELTTTFHLTVYMKILGQPKLGLAKFQYLQEQSTAEVEMQRMDE